MGFRRDFHLTCDAAGFCVASGDAIDGIVADGASDPGRWIDADQLLLVQMIGDDYFYGRLVVAEELSEAESAEWLAQIRGVLTSRSGALHIGAGFDPDVLDWTRTGDAEDAGFKVEIPAGTYQVEVTLTHRR